MSSYSAKPACHRRRKIQPGATAESNDESNWGCQGSPLNTCTQYKHNGHKYLPRRQGLATASWPTPILAGGFARRRWNQRLDLFPEFIRNTPLLSVLSHHMLQVVTFEIGRIPYYLRIRTNSNLALKIEQVIRFNSLIYHYIPGCTIHIFIAN